MLFICINWTLDHYDHNQIYCQSNKGTCICFFHANDMMTVSWFVRDGLTGPSDGTICDQRHDVSILPMFAGLFLGDYTLDESIIMHITFSIFQ